MSNHSRPELSDRENQLVKLAAAGHTDTSIAHQLGISEATVSTYWQRIRAKIGPFSRPEIIATIIREELNETVEKLKEENTRLVGELQKSTGKEWNDPQADFYHKLVLSAADPILIIGEDGTIETVNDETLSLFGYEAEELEQSHLSVLIPDRYKMIHNQHREEYMTNPQKRKMAAHSTAFGRHKTGREFPIAASLSAVESGAGVKVVCIVRAMPEAPLLQG